MKSWLLPRRTFLRGVGTSILLPVLDAMIPKDALAAAAFGPRFAALFMPDGIYGQGVNYAINGPERYYSTAAYSAGGLGAWRPAQVGPLPASLPLILQPLNSLKGKINIVSGLSSIPKNAASSINQHSLATTAWLTAAYDTTEEANQLIAGKKRSLVPPDSVDQALANSMGITPGSSIVFNPHHAGGAGFISESNGGYNGAISFNSKMSGNHLVPQSSSPKSVFDSLFKTCVTGTATPPPQGPTDTQITDDHILDRVIGSIRDVKKKLGKNDQIRLESYLQFIEDLEKQNTAAMMQQPTMPGSGDKWCPQGFAVAGADWYSQVNAMIDVIAFALATDAKPVASIMLGSEWFNPYYSQFVLKYGDFVGVGGSKVTFPTTTTDVHNDIAHKAKKGNGLAGVASIEQYIAYNRMQMQFMKRLMDRLASFPKDPNGLSPLDNSLILFGACHSDGYTHNVHNLPILLGGGAGYGLNQGQHIAMPMSTDIGNFHYTLLRGMGVNTTSFNGHNAYLNGLFKV